MSTVSPVPRAIPRPVPPGARRWIKAYTMRWGALLALPFAAFLSLANDLSANLDPHGSQASTVSIFALSFFAAFVFAQVYGQFLAMAAQLVFPGEIKPLAVAAGAAIVPLFPIVVVLVWLSVAGPPDSIAGLLPFIGWIALEGGYIWMGNRALRAALDHFPAAPPARPAR